MAYYISQGKVETPIHRGGQCCCSFVANLHKYPYAKNYKNTIRFDKAIATIEECNFFASQCRTHWSVAGTLQSRVTLFVSASMRSLLSVFVSVERAPVGYSVRSWLRFQVHPQSSTIYLYFEHFQPKSKSKRNKRSNGKVIWQKAPHGGPIPQLGVTPGGRKLHHWIPGVGFPISVL